MNIDNNLQENTIHERILELENQVFNINTVLYITSYLTAVYQITKTKIKKNRYMNNTEKKRILIRAIFWPITELLDLIK